MKKVKLNVLALSVIAFLVMITACKQDTLTAPSETQMHQNRLKCNHLKAPESLQTEEGLSLRANQAFVAPIILIPNGSSNLTDYQRQQVELGLENVRDWYQRELPNKDIRWEKIRYLQGNQTGAHYVVNNNVWSEIPGEIQAAFGWNPWQNNSGTNRIALVLGRDLLGWAGANTSANGNGLAIAGLESLIDLPQVSNEWWGTQEYWHGTVIHELGHALGLPGHHGIASSIMDAHGNYKNKHLTNKEKTIVEGNLATTTKGPVPIAHWDFDEDFKDQGNGNNDLTAKKGATQATGLIELAGSFDGVNDVAETASNRCNVSNKVTISAWVKPSSTSGSQTIVNKWYAKDSYSLGIKNGQFVFSVAFPGGTWGTAKSISIPAKANEWQHVIGVYDGEDDNTLTIYLDNITKPGSQSRQKIVQGGNLQSSTRPVAVGSHPSWNSFKGLIDKITIYNDEVSISQLSF